MIKNRKILVPLDESSLSAQTTTKLIALKDSISFPLTLLHVHDLSLISYRGFAGMDFKEIERRSREKAERFIDAQKELFAAAGMEVKTLLQEGHARETICEIADSGEYDLLVIGKHADGELRNLVFGQVANYVVHHTRCPVLIV